MSVFPEGNDCILRSNCSGGHLSLSTDRGRPLHLQFPLEWAYYMDTAQGRAGQPPRIYPRYFFEGIMKRVPSGASGRRLDSFPGAGWSVVKSLRRSWQNVLTDRRIFGADGFGIGFFTPEDNLQGVDQRIFRLFSPTKA
jgi:hypothetical protein